MVEPRSVQFDLIPRKVTSTLLALNDGQSQLLLHHEEIFMEDVM